MSRTNRKRTQKLTPYQYSLIKQRNGYVLTDQDRQILAIQVKK